MAVGLSGGLGLTSCLLELDDAIACGDEYIDYDAGEQCEPAIKASYIDACFEELRIDRAGSCDPNTCRIDLRSCNGPCGNGQLDVGEECDPGAPIDPELVDGFEVDEGVPCSELPPPSGVSQYVGGFASRCQSDCTWNRDHCHHCGDARIQAPEVCDGSVEDLDAVDEYCLSACVDPGVQPRPAEVSCRTQCADDCLGYVAAEQGLLCCIPNGHVVSTALPCCSGFQDSNVCGPGLGGKD